MRLRTFYSTILLWLNRIYNVYRARHGQPYYSLSQAIKQKVKSAVSYISDFEEELVKFARTRNATVSFAGTFIIRQILIMMIYIILTPVTGWKLFRHS